MSENSKIQWTHHTFNPWRGCTKVSAGCDHCYAETSSKRNPKVLGVWGDDGTRPTASEAYWREPIRWNRDAAAAGERRRVFCASLADVGEDRPDLVEPRARLSDVIRATPFLDWLLLTKRIENMERLFPRDVLERSYVGTTTEDQQRADERIPKLLETPAAVRFISAEPLLGPIDLTRIRFHIPGNVGLEDWDALDSHGTETGCTETLDWVIVGGESGPGARPFNVNWARSIAVQCHNAGVPVFIKQLGADPFEPYSDGSRFSDLNLRDRKGGDMEEWSEDLRVRQFPEQRA